MAHHLQLIRSITVILALACVSAFAQVTTLQCSGTAHFPQVLPGSVIPAGTSMAYSGTVTIDSTKGVFSGDLFSATAIAGFPMHEVEITEVKTNDIGGKRGFTSRSGAAHALNVSIDRNTGKLALYEFPEGGRTAFSGFSLMADCRVARPLF